MSESKSQIEKFSELDADEDEARWDERLKRIASQACAGEVGVILKIGAAK